LVDKISKSDNFYLMQNNIAHLSKQAIDSALKGNWQTAIDLNTQILKKHPDDIDTKARLGRALLQQKDFTKAKKLFKEILDKDPINPIAIKNYKLAKEKATIKNSNVEQKADALLKEPGTSIEIKLNLTGTRVTAEDLSHGQELKIKLTRTSAKFYRNTTILGEITDQIVINGLQKAKNNGGLAKARFVGGTGKSISVLIFASTAVFKSAKQAIKPYLKRETLNEPELEMRATEERE
jgi:tetratricopeptide (TPR) repeat protein